MDPEQFRRDGTAAINRLADFFAELESLPVTPMIEPGDIVRALPEEPPAQGVPMDRILDDVENIIVPGMTHWSHPRFFGYFVSSGSGPGVLGELLAAGLNSNAMTWHSCPASAELEVVVLDWLRRMLVLPADFEGSIVEGASLGAVLALAAAREARGLDIRRLGMSGRDDVPRLVVYVSEQAHSSIDKAVGTLGIGVENIRRIPTDDAMAMRPDELARRIDADIAEGRLPVCIVATIGTTSTAAVDPLAAIGRIAAERGVWLHVDAAYGGAAAITTTHRGLLNGSEFADSITVNPHKWLFVPLDLSVLYVKDRKALERAFSYIPVYLDTPAGHDMDFMSTGITLGRRFRALKLWFVIRYFGRDGLAHLITRHMEMARRFGRWVEENERLELAFPVSLGTVCFRVVGATEDDSDRRSKALIDFLNSTRQVLLTHTRVEGRFIIRLVVGGIRTRTSDLTRLEELIQQGLDGI